MIVCACITVRYVVVRMTSAVSNGFITLHTTKLEPGSISDYEIETALVYLK